MRLRFSKRNQGTGLVMIMLVAPLSRAGESGEREMPAHAIPATVRTRAVRRCG